MSLKNISTISRRELKSYLDNPAAYVVALAFLVLWEFLFFLNAFVVGEASLRGLFDWLPWLSLLLIPAVTMGSIAQEKNEGTLEVVLTHPVKELELIIGKFFGSFTLIGILYLFALPISVTFSWYGQVDFGVVLGQLIGSWLFSAAFIALGIFISAAFTSQVAALLVSAVLGFLFLISGSDFITVTLPLILVPVFERLSLLSHFQSMNRGVLDLRDLWYFGTFCIVFLTLAYLSLLQRKYGNRKDQFQYIRVGLSLFIGIAILTNIIGSRIPGRLDLTTNKNFSLSPATRNILNGLTDIVTITFYASTKLPAQYAPLVRDTRDLLRDYQNLAKGNLKVSLKDPSENPQLAQEAANLGIKEVQFNVIGQEEFQLKTGFVGIVISFADKHETLPFLQTTGDLEYQLTSSIRKLTNKNKKTVAFMTGNGEKSPFSEYQQFNTELNKLFDVTTTQIATDTPQIASQASVLIVAGPTSKLEDKTISAIKQFLDTGKGAIFLADSFSVAPQMQSLTPSANGTNFSDLIKDFGVTVNKDIVYDLRSHETVRLGSGPVSFLMPYQFWVRTLVGKDASKIINQTSQVVLPWASSLTLDEEKLKKDGYNIIKLLTTTPASGVETNNVTLSPDKYNFSQDNLSEKLLAVALTPSLQSGINAKSNLVIVGDSDFLSDQFMQSSDNLSFGLSVISWLANDEALTGIKTRQGDLQKLVFQNQTQTSLVKYGNLLLVILIPVSLAAFRILRRRHLSQLHYQ